MTCNTKVAQPKRELDQAEDKKCGIIAPEHMYKGTETSTRLQVVTTVKVSPQTEERVLTSARKSAPAIARPSLSLARVIYCSRASDAMAADIDNQFAPLLEQSQRNNKPHGVTGGLIYADRWFIQVLEGPANAIAETFARIKVDPRHHSVQVFMNTWATGREFTECSMWGYKLPPARCAMSSLLKPHDASENTMHLPPRALDLIIAARALGEHDDIMFID